jgi:hypothetical protein
LLLLLLLLRIKFTSVFSLTTVRTNGNLEYTGALVPPKAAGGRCAAIGGPLAAGRQHLFQCPTKAWFQYLYPCCGCRFVCGDGGFKYTEKQNYK